MSATSVRTSKAEERFASRLEESSPSKDATMRSDNDVDIDAPQLQNRRCRTASTRCSSTTSPLVPRPPSSARQGIAAPRSHLRGSDERFLAGRASSVRGQTHMLDRAGAESTEPTQLPPRPATVAAHRARSHAEEDLDDDYHALRKYSLHSPLDSPVRPRGDRFTGDDHHVREPLGHQPAHSSSDEEHVGSHRVVPQSPGSDQLDDKSSYWMQTSAIVSASDRIQAYKRPYYSKAIMAEELAKDDRHNRRVQALLKSEVLKGTPGGIAANKRREAWNIVRSARQVYVENGAAVCIQKCWRGYITRHTVQEEIARIAHETATQLQSLFRRYCVIKRHEKRVHSAMIIQASWRRYSIAKRQQWMNGCKALVTRLLTGMVHRNKQWSTSKSAVTFQRIIRGSNLRHHLEYIGRHRTKIHKVVRGTVLRRRLARQSAAVRTIGARWHGVLVRKEMAAKFEGAVRFQTLFRKYKARSRVFRMQHASRKIAALWSSYRMRKMLAHASKAKVIQAWFRGLLARKRLNLQSPAASKIQHVWTRMRQRNKFRISVAIAIVLQKHSRRQ